MSILINMERPTHCMDCPFMVSHYNNNCILQSAEANESFESWKQMKANCPLIPIPPHGDLIERDALTISTAVPLDGKPYQYVHIDSIKGAPTIIPASGKGVDATTKEEI